MKRKQIIGDLVAYVGCQERVAGHPQSNAGPWPASGRACERISRHQSACATGLRGVPAVRPPLLLLLIQPRASAAVRMSQSYLV
jgi:hypothetical protein